jgi:hypothetical protein
MCKGIVGRLDFVMYRDTRRARVENLWTGRGRPWERRWAAVDSFSQPALETIRERSDWLPRNTHQRFRDVGPVLACGRIRELEENGPRRANDGARDQQESS